MAAPFDRYWRTRIGSVEEYLQAANEEGLELELHQDLSSRATSFWTLTLDLMTREREAEPAGQRSVGRSVSQREHLRLMQGLIDGGLHHGLLLLKRPR
jgi:hypothetical protein